MFVEADIQESFIVYQIHFIKAKKNKTCSSTGRTTQQKKRKR